MTALEVACGRRARKEESSGVGRRRTGASVGMMIVKFKHHLSSLSAARVDDNHSSLTT
jgi:hypothetical protein